MEVMNNDVFSQTETLVGQAGKTRSMGVSDDPMLMSMLSTGFYANPLRTMIQEVMFNAWDAHKMGNCQDKPIDIYINEISGLIIRDYGPGISDENMVPVYCIYGNSTKRKDKSQTGGFGLGCKSPFSYTESFTVTSMHNGIKSMYLVSRVSDEAEGKPGLTPLVTIPTDETGLMVTVPLEKGDENKALEHINNVLYLSGIKANIHYKDDEVKYVESKELKPGQYIVSTGDKYQYDTDHYIYAVYGGVRYKITHQEEYSDELSFMKILSQNTTLYIGFAPDTLTPLPNREGLNMSSKTKENIKVCLEICMEKFRETFEPLVHAYFRKRFDDYVAHNIQPQFALYHSLGVMHNGDKDFLYKFEKEMKPLVPLNMDKNVWEISVKLMVLKINDIVNIITKKRWIIILVQHFIRVYPEHKQLGFNVLKEISKNTLYYYDGESREEIIASWIQPEQMRKLFKFEQEIKKQFSHDKAFKAPKLRLNDSGKFVEMVRHKNKGKRTTKSINYYSKDKFIVKEPNYQNNDRIWDARDSSEVNQMFMSNTVILAKTVQVLNEEDTHIGIANNNRSEKMYHYSDRRYKNKLFTIVPAYVVHSRKGAYEAAKSILVSMGFKVLECKEPEKKSYTSKKDKPKNQYNRINTSKHNWCSYLIDDQIKDYDPKEDGIPLTDPTHFLYVKVLDIDNTFYSRRVPDKALVNKMLEIYPDIAMVNTESQANAMIKKDIKPFSDCLEQWFKSLNSKVYRIRNITRIINILDKSEIPKSMLDDINIQSAMGLSKIKKDDVSFWNDLKIISLIKNDSYEPDVTFNTKKELNQLIQTTWNNDPAKIKTIKAIEASKVFDQNSLNRKYTSLTDSEKVEFCKNIARYIRAI